MKLEEEIKQSKFKDEFHKLIVNLIYTGSWVNLNNTQFLKQFDITPQMYNILRILKGQHPKPSTVNLLIERMLDKSSNVSRIIDRLVKKQLVKRGVSKEDRRAVDINITEKGIQLLNSIIPKDDQRSRKMLTSITLEEASILNSLLDKLRSI